jgi:hypothetical protein
MSSKRRLWEEGAGTVSSRGEGVPRGRSSASIPPSRVLKDTVDAPVARDGGSKGRMLGRGGSGERTKQLRSVLQSRATANPHTIAALMPQQPSTSQGLWNMENIIFGQE